MSEFALRRTGLRANGRHEVRTGGPSDRLSALPVEVIAHVLLNSDLPQRIAAGNSCRKLRALCAREMQMGVRELLQRFNLSHSDVRFMQTATRAIIAGPAVMQLQFHAASHVELDFYAPASQYQRVLRFLSLALHGATGIGTTPPTVAFSSVNGVTEITRMQVDGGHGAIRVHCSENESALRTRRSVICCARSRTTACGLAIPGRCRLESPFLIATVWISTGRQQRQWLQISFAVPEIFLALRSTWRLATDAESIGIVPLRSATPRTGDVWTYSSRPCPSESQNGRREFTTLDAPWFGL